MINTIEIKLGCQLLEERDIAHLRSLSFVQLRDIEGGDKLVMLVSPRDVVEKDCDCPEVILLFGECLLVNHVYFNIKLFTTDSVFRRCVNVEVGQVVLEDLVILIDEDEIPRSKVDHIGVLVNQFVSNDIPHRLLVEVNLHVISSFQALPLSLRALWRGYVDGTLPYALILEAETHVPVSALLEVVVALRIIVMKVLSFIRD